MNRVLSNKQLAQEDQYYIPYHYIPKLDENGFSQTFSWSWGMRYFAGVELVLSVLDNNEFNSLLDVGCGDGRFLREVALRHPHNRILGVDYSERAINLAKAMNPDIDYRCLDIKTSTLKEQYDVITMIEVLEHIPPHEIDFFLAGINRAMHSHSKLILTVPHINKKVQNKHYQHFSSKSLNQTLATHFRVESIAPFDRLSRITSRLLWVLGYFGNNFIITNRYLNNLLYKRILKGCIKPLPESQSGRLLAIAKIK